MKVVTKISRWLSVVGSLLMRVSRWLLSLCSRGKHIKVKYEHHERKEIAIDKWEDLNMLTGGDIDDLEG